MRRDDIVMPTTPQTRVPRSGGRKSSYILIWDHPTNPYGAVIEPDSWPVGQSFLGRTSHAQIAPAKPKFPLPAPPSIIRSGHNTPPLAHPSNYHGLTPTIVPQSD